MDQTDNNSNFSIDIELKSEVESPEPEMRIEDIKVEESDIFYEEEYIKYECQDDTKSSESDDEAVTHIDEEYLKTPKRKRYTANSQKNVIEKNNSIIHNKVESTQIKPIKGKRGRPRKHPKPDSSITTKRNNKCYIQLEIEGGIPNESVQSEAASDQTNFLQKQDSSNLQRELHRVIVPKFLDDHAHDSDYIPPKNLKCQDASEQKNVINNRMYIKNYKRTVSHPDCIFKDCNLRDTTLIPNNVRIKMLQEYKLYILKSSKACSVHMRDQNWDELLKCTYNDFTAVDIEDLLKLFKQASQVTFDFERIETIPTRFIRYWMNVNKVQYQRIYDRFPSLQDLKSPKTALCVYLMYLQQNDVERIALLLQLPELGITEKIKSVQAIVPFQTYDELNDMFQLEY